MPGRDDSTAYAANWRTVLAVDAGLGAVVALVGLAVLWWVNAVAGGAMIGAGTIYVSLVGARARRWSRLRRAAPRSAP